MIPTYSIWCKRISPEGMYKYEYIIRSQSVEAIFLSRKNLFDNLKTLYLLLNKPKIYKAIPIRFSSNGDSL